MGMRRLSCSFCVSVREAIGKGVKKIPLSPGGNSGKGGFKGPLRQPRSRHQV